MKNERPLSVPITASPLIYSAIFKAMQSLKLGLTCNWVMGAGFATTSCDGHVVVLFIPNPGVAYNSSFSSSPGIYFQGLVAPLDSPDIATLYGLKLPVVSVLVRSSSWGHCTGSSLIVNSIYVSLTSDTVISG